MRIVNETAQQNRDILDFTIDWDADPPTLTIPSPPSSRKIEVTFTAGYGERAGDVPADIRQAILNYITCIYEERQGIDRKNLIGLYDLLHPYRLVRLS